VGFPIRKSADQRLFAPPHGLSQRTTSFIASQRQGIHRILLRHLIALIIDVHRSAAAGQSFRIGLGIDRKTSLLQTHPRTPRSSRAHLLVMPTERRPDHGLSQDLTFLAEVGCISSLRCQKTPRSAEANRETVWTNRSGSRDQPPGGARRDRTDDLMLAKHALSQLSYGPKRC
jgi:alpha-ketoglutarate-dependent taurine dioxygenase